MGNLFTPLTDDEHFFSYLLCAAESSKIMPDVGIDESLLKYSGLNSASVLQDSVTQALKDVGSKTPDYLESLGSGLSQYDTVPNAVGLGALVLSILLEIMIRSVQKSQSQDSTVDMVRRVFAEEKASGVRDSMEEYMKRLGMYLQQPTEAIKETERLEKQLSEQLTRLKNSMLHDKQMSSRSMKHWTNGAAFHLQMLIHAARLKTQNTAEHEAQLHVHVASIISVLDRYQDDLQNLLEQYKTYKKSNVFLLKPQGFPDAPNFSTGWGVEDRELGKETDLGSYHKQMRGSSEAYIDYMFENWSVIKKLKSYFTDLRSNVEELITQNVPFSMPKFGFGGVCNLSQVHSQKYTLVLYRTLAQVFSSDCPRDQRSD